MSTIVRIGTRSSPMALAQVDRVSALLRAADPELTVEVVAMTTSGDRWTGPLSDLGGKGAFTKEVDAALLGGACDLAVHCVKDIPGDRPVPEGTDIVAFLERDDVRDAVVQPDGITLDDLPEGARIGTSSPRRAAQLALHWPHLLPVPVRGNANSRLAKLDAGEYDALLLAVAGLERIDLTERISQILPVDAMVPAVGSGTLALQCRTDDDVTNAYARALRHEPTWLRTTAERTMLSVLDGNCHSPIAGYATLDDGTLSLHGRVIAPDGKTVLDASGRGTDPEALGTDVAAELLRQGAADIISATA
ncbi:hydroxymethylbilane synthase [Stackebrandtia soli]|uniref:hydroxymethylbilane synthase n=1 Tax=Stackebrandtia soli TaxID=1892856 RepID=UPI0039EC4E24